MSYSSYSHSGGVDDTDANEELDIDIVDEFDEYDNSQIVNISTASYESMPTELPEEVPMEGFSPVGFGLITAYECNEEFPTQWPDDDSLSQLLGQVNNPGVKLHVTRGWTGSKGGSYNESKDMDQGKNVNQSDYQFENVPCWTYPLRGGWDYVDYTPNTSGVTQLGDGVTPILTIPCGPPRGYGNISHNRVSYEQTSGWTKIRHHMTGIKWNHVKKKGEGLQEDIKYTTDWESGRAYTADNAGYISKQPGIHTHVAGSNSWASKDGSDVMFGKWKQKASNMSKWYTPNNILIGHDSEKGDPTTMDFGVVGFSGFMYPHVSDIDGKAGDSTNLCSFQVHHMYGIYRWDSDDDEVDARVEAGQEAVEYLKEIIEEITEGEEGEASFSADENIADNYTDNSVHNFMMRLYESGRWKKAKEKVFKWKSDLGLSHTIRALCEFVSAKLPINEGVADWDKDFDINGEFLQTLLDYKGEINAHDLFSYLYTRVYGVPEGALKVLGSTLDLEAMAAYSRDVIHEHVHLHRFVFWAFINKGATHIQKVDFDAGEYLITLGNGIKITFAEWVHYFDWGYSSTCERNGGQLSSNALQTEDGKWYLTERWCVDREMWEDDPDHPQHIMERMPMNGRVYIGKDANFIDENNNDAFELENRYLPPVSPMATNDGWADQDDFVKMTKFYKIRAFKTVGSPGVPPTWYKSPYSKDYVEKEMTYKFKKGESKIFYDWIILDNKDANGNIKRDMPAMEFWFAYNRDGSGAPKGEQPWVKTVASQPNLTPIGRTVSRPAGAKAAGTNERLFMRVVTQCPKREAVPDCKEYMKQFKYKKPGEDFNVQIVPAIRGGTGDNVSNAYQGPCYWAEDVGPGQIPEPDWYDTTWKQINRETYSSSAGKKFMKAGKRYELYIPKGTNPILDEMEDPIYPELHIYYGRDEESLIPLDEDTDRKNLYTYSGQAILQGPGQHDPIIIEPQTDYVFYAASKSGRLRNEFSDYGEDWVIAKEIAGTSPRGPAYFGEVGSHSQYPNGVMFNVDYAWSEINTFKYEGNLLTPGAQYTIKANNNSVASYKVVFAMSEDALHPKQHGITNANMISGQHYYDTGVVINKLAVSGSFPAHTFYAPSPYMILVAHDCDPDPDTGQARTIDNWSKMGEPAGPDPDTLGFTFTKKGDNSQKTKGQAFYAIHGADYNPDDPTTIKWDLNRNNNYSKYELGAGEIDFNNGYWKDPLQMVIDYDDQGMPIVPGDYYEVEVLEQDDKKGFDLTKVHGTYNINWLLKREESKHFKRALGNTLKDDQKKWGTYFKGSPVEEWITARLIGDSDQNNELRKRVVQAHSDSFVVGLAKSNNYDQNPVTMSQWPITGAPVQVIVKKAGIRSGAVYPAYESVSSQNNSVGKIPFHDENYCSYFDMPFTTFSQNGIKVEKGKKYKLTWDKSNTLWDSSDKFDVTFWWINNKQRVNENPISGAGKQAIASTDGAGRYTWFRQSMNEIVVTALEDYLVLGGVSPLSPEIAIGEWGRKGRPIYLTMVEAENEPDDTEGLEGPSYITLNNEHFPDIWDERFQEPITLQKYFTNSLGIKSGIKRAAKYRLKLKAEASCDARVIFAMFPHSAYPKQILGTTLDNALDTQDYYDTGVDLIRGGDSIELYAPSIALFYGAFNNDTLDNGDARTIANWSENGEPLNPYSGYDPAEGDPLLEMTLIEQPGQTKGPVYHAMYPEDSSTGLPSHDVNRHDPNKSVFVIGDGMIDFFDHNWDPFVNSISEVFDNEGNVQPIVAGEYYDISLMEEPGFEYRAKYLVNWITDANAESPDSDIDRTGEQGFRPEYRANYDNVSNSTDDDQAGGSLDTLVLEHGRTVTLKAYGTRFVLGCFDFTQNKPDHEKYNNVYWSPNGQPAQITVTRNLNQTTGPAYLAKAATANDRPGIIPFNDARWKLPFNSYEQQGLFLEKNRNYRIKYKRNDSGQIIDQNTYSFWWLDDRALSSKTVGNREVSKTHTYDNIIILDASRPDGVVVKCRENFLLFGAIPNDPTVTEWSSTGAPVNLEVTLTTDPQTDDDVDNTIEGPAYFADDANNRPNIGDVKWNQPITFSTGGLGDNRIVRGNAYTIKAKDATSDLHPFFLMSESAERPRDNGITLDNMLDGGHFTDLGITLPKDGSRQYTFFAPSEKMIFGTKNHDDLDGEARTFENWSPSGEPGNVNLTDDPDSGFEIVNDPMKYNSGPAFWADHNGFDLDASTSLVKGQVDFFQSWWEPRFKFVKGTTTGLIELPDGSMGTEDMVPGARYEIKISEDAQYQWGGKFRINWVLDDEGLDPRVPNTNVGLYYDRMYSMEEQLLDPGVTYTIRAQSKKFIVGVQNITKTTTGGSLNSMYNWSPKGFPVIWEIKKLADVKGPAYLSSDVGAVDWLNNDWDTPFNTLDQPGTPIEAGKVYSIERDTDDSGQPIYSGYTYHFVVTNGLGKSQGIGVSGQDYVMCTTPDSDVTLAVWNDVAGQDPPQFKTPDGILGSPDAVDFLLVAAYDPNNPGTTIAEWGIYGRPVNFKIKLEDEIEVGERGPAYYGSATGENYVTDFSNAHWEKVHHWNIAPQNAVTDENPNPVLFQENGYYRLLAKNETEPKSDFAVIYGTHPGFVWVGDDHFRMSGEYGKLVKNNGILDLKDIDYTDIVFCSYNTSGDYTLDAWSPEGVPLDITVQDLTDGVPKDDKGNYIKGPAYFGGFNKQKAENNFTNLTFIGPLNTFAGIDMDARYIVAAPNDMKGKVEIAFAKNNYALVPGVGQEDDIFMSGVVLQAGEQRYIRASSDLVLASHYNVPGYTVIGDWSRDGQPLDLIFLKVNSPGEDGDGNELKGPAYWADSDARHEVDWMSFWWADKLNELLPGRFVVGNKYRLTGADSLESGVKYKVWYGGRNSDIPSDTTVYRTNDEIFEKGTSVEIEVLDEKIFLAAFNTGRDFESDWGWDGEPAEVLVEDLDGRTILQGPGYYGSANENLTLGDFTDHYTRMFHWNNAPHDEEVTYVSRGKNYRFSAVKLTNNKPGAGGWLTSHDYDIYAAKDEASMVPGPENPGNFTLVGTLLRENEWVDVRELEYDKLIFCAINLGASASREDWSPEGEPVIIDVAQLNKGNRDPQGRYKKGPAYFCTGQNDTPDFSNKKWIGPLNYFPGVVQNTRYKVTAQGFTGTLKIYFAHSEEALDNRNNTNFLFEDSGVELKGDEEVEVSAISPYMIFGHYGKTAKTFENWGQDGEEANITIEIAPEEQITGPAYYGELNPENEPHWLDPNVCEPPLNPFEQRTVNEGQEYILETLAHMPTGIKYKMWFSDTANPTPQSRFVTNEVVVDRTSGDTRFTALGDYMYFGAFNTGKNQDEWSRRGEPIAAILKTVPAEDTEGPGYYGSRNETNVLTDFSDEHWEDRVTHWNVAPQNAAGSGAVYFERGNAYRISKIPGETQYDYKVYGATNQNALSVGEDHDRSFHEYGLINNERDQLDIKSVGYPNIVFCTANTPNEDNLVTWPAKGKKVNLKVEQVTDLKTNPDGSRVTGYSYFQNTPSSHADFSHTWWLNYLNYRAGFVKDRKYIIKSLNTNDHDVRLYWANHPDAFDTQINSNSDFVATDVRLKPGEEATLTAGGRYLICGGYNKTGVTTINDWSRDGEFIDFEVTEYEYDPNQRGPLYWADNARKTVPWTAEHWNKPLNSSNAFAFKKNNWYEITKKSTQPIDGRVSMVWSDDPYALNPKDGTVYINDDDAEWTAGDNSVKLVKAKGKYLFFRAYDLSNNHEAKNDFTFWHPDGERFDIEVTEKEFPEGPEYWADGPPLDPSWQRGLPDFRTGAGHTSYWNYPINFVPGIKKNTEYEVRLPLGQVAQYDYYIWQTDEKKLDDPTLHKNDFDLLGVISKNTIQTVGAYVTKKHVFVGVRQTGMVESEWSPYGQETSLEFNKLRAGLSGISYFAEYKDTVGINVVGSERKQGRKIDWNNEKWRRPGNTNFNAAGPGVGAFHRNREYRVTLSKKNPKYIYSIWTIDRRALAPGPDTVPGVGGRHFQENISLQKGMRPKQAFFPKGDYMVLAAFEFNKDSRSLVNWSSNGEHVKVKIKATADQQVEIPWGPIMSAVTQALEMLAMLLALIFGLIGVLKPEMYMVNFDEPAPFDELQLSNNDDENHKTHGRTYASLGHPIFFNKIADIESRFIIRFASLRFNGYLVNASNHKGAKTGTGESHWYINLGFQNIAATHSLSFADMGNRDKTRIMAFQRRHGDSEDEHVRRPVKWSKKDYHVSPRKLVTKRDDLKESETWEEDNRWFNIGAAYALRAPNSQSWSVGEYYYKQVGSESIKYNTRIEAFMESTDGSSQKSSKQKASAAPVNTDGDGWSVPTEDRHLEHIFTDRGMSQWFRSKGKSESKNRCFHYVLGIEGEEYDYNQYSNDGTFVWPVWPDGQPQQDKFFPGIEFDLKRPGLNDGTNDGDYQFVYFRMQVKRKDEFYGTSGYGRPGTNEGYSWFNRADVIDLYPTEESEPFLFRVSSSSGSHGNDMYYQVPANPPLKIVLAATRKIDPTAEMLTAFSYGVMMGSSNSKTYTYSWNIANLKPRAWAKKPSLVASRKDYDEIYG